MQARNLAIQSDPWGHIPFEPALHITTNYSFPATSDGPTIKKYVKGLTIDAGAILTTSVRCKGLVLFVNGDCVINGTLSMTARGAYAAGDNLAIDYKKAEFLVSPTDWANYEHRISAAGGTGGAYRTATGPAEGILQRAGNTGSSSALASGGGGSGGVYASYGRTATSGAGGDGTSYSGGSGSGGAAVNNTANRTSSAGGANGGAGSAGACIGASSTVRSAGGGAGNNGGAPCSSYHTGTAGSNGTGGLLILVVSGNLYISETGLVSANGMPGGYGVAGGGSSGGGIVKILHAKGYSNLGTVQANGGIGGNGTALGGAGGTGLVSVSQITL